MNKLFAYLLMAAIALSMTALTACSSDDETVEPVRPEVPETPETPEVEEDDTIRLTESFGGIYFGQFWRKTEGELWANYYVMLTNDEVGVTGNGDPAPMHEGGWVFFLDFWGEAAIDHTKPVLPEGSYTLGSDRNWNRLTNGTTLATRNVEKVFDEASNSYKYRIEDVFFSEGTLTVAHTEQGYKFEGTFTTTTGEELKVAFEGKIEFTDKSDDEEWSTGMEGDVEMKPVQGWTYRSSQKETCDKHLIYLFDVETLTSDALHAGVVGGKKLQLTIYTAIDGSLAGTYTAGTPKPNSFTLEEEKPGIYYPGSYWGTNALGSFIEYVQSDTEILYSILKSGTITITENTADGTHTIVVDGQNEHGGKITCNWTGVLGGKPNA